MMPSGAARRAGCLSRPADEELAAKILQRAWWSHIDRRLFRLLTHAIRAAEHCITYEIMRRVSPLEAELIKDPSMQCKVRFRFAGHEFPPFIVFKIFHHTGGQGSKYISGKRTISPASEIGGCRGGSSSALLQQKNWAAVDACKLMGHRKYYDQMIWDELQYQNHKIIDEIDVATVKDYMQYISNLDETPAYFGGRDNCWRKLSLENFPRTMIMYDIMDYAQSGTLSNPLKEKLTFLLLRPQNEELRHDQLMTVSRVRSPTPCPPTATSSSRSYQPSSLPRPSVRRSRQARQKVAKMKRVHALEKEREEQKLDVTSRSHLTEHQETMTAPIEDREDHSVFSDEEWEHEAAKLYAWSQELSLEDIEESLRTPNF